MIGKMTLTELFDYRAKAWQLKIDVPLPEVATLAYTAAKLGFINPNQKFRVYDSVPLDAQPLHIPKALLLIDWATSTGILPPTAQDLSYVPDGVAFVDYLFDEMKEKTYEALIEIAQGKITTENTALVRGAINIRKQSPNIELDLWQQMLLAEAMKSKRIDATDLYLTLAGHGKGIAVEDANWALQCYYKAAGVDNKTDPHKIANVWNLVVSEEEGSVEKLKSSVDVATKALLQGLVDIGDPLLKWRLVAGETLGLVSHDHLKAVEARHAIEYTFRQPNDAYDGLPIQWYRVWLVATGNHITNREDENGKTYIETGKDDNVENTLSQAEEMGIPLEIITWAREVGPIRRAMRNSMLPKPQGPVFPE